MTGYRARAVCRLTGITYRQLDYWDRTGLLCPSVAEGRGSGTSRVYNYDDLMVLSVIGHLIRAGFTPAQCRELVDRLRDEVGGRTFTIRQVGAVKVTVDLSKIRSALHRSLHERAA